MRTRVAKSTLSLLRQNLDVVKLLYPELRPEQIAELRSLTQTLQLSISRGEIRRIDDKWYITHAGLLRIAFRRRCRGIRTVLQERFCDPSGGRWVFKATVFTARRSRGFVGYGDADPSNVSTLVHGAEMRVAETRAIVRALRQAYGIGLCAIEELGWAPRSYDSGSSNQRKASTTRSDGHENSQPRLRDRLCLLIRQYRLDAALVKAYAADFCNTPTLRDASRDQLEAFVNKLAKSAACDREALICRLNGYARQPEANS